MKSFSIKMVRLAELVAVVDSIPPKDLQTMKDIRLTTNIVKDLTQAAQNYFDQVLAIQLPQNEIVLKFQKQFQQETISMEDEQKKDFEKQLNKEMADEVNQFNKDHKDEIDAINARSNEEINIALDDEKFSKLKELFDKYAAEKYTNKAACLEVADALEAGK